MLSKASLSVPDNTKPTRPPLRDRLIPWYFVMAFGVVLVVNGLFVYLALENHAGVVTENPYKKGLEYNRTIAGARAQEALGWQSDIAYRDGRLIFTLKDRRAAPVQGATVQVFVRRPLEQDQAFALVLEENARGVYSALVSFPLAGQWITSVTASWQNQRYQNTRRLVVR